MIERTMDDDVPGTLRLEPRPRRRRAGYRAGTLASAVFHLRHLLAAGVPLADALDDVARLEPGGGRRALWRSAADEVAAGSNLSDALARWPHDLDPAALALVRAGEASGRLTALLAELEAHLRWRDELATRLRTVTLYPAFAALLLIGVVGFLLGHVVPELAGFLDDGGASLPWHGALLLSLSDVVGSYGVALLALAVLPLAGFVAAPRFGSSAERLRDTFVLRAGVVGQLVAALRTARWARTVALLYGAGVALDEALRIAEGTLGDRALEAELGAARTALLDGRGLGPALADGRFVPPTLARLIAAGESAGVLERALHHGGEQLQSASRHAVARVEAMLGPVLLGVTGLLLLWIVVSVLGPLYAGVGEAGFA